MTSVKQKNILRRASRMQVRAGTLKRWGLGLLFVWLTLAPILYTRVGGSTRVYAAASNQLNFQARLLSGTGAIVPDGNYSIQFNLYSVATGGTTQWTETQGIVPVRAGYVSVYLGSVVTFPGTIDWSQQQWLTLNINGDGEMTPRLKLTAVPNALHANESDALRSGANLLTADNFAQLTPTTPQVINSALAALRLNQTGAGLLAQLQHNGSDVFTLANNGDLVSSGSGTFSGGNLTLGSATQQGGLILHDGAGKTGTLKTSTLSANRNYTLPDADGTVCLTTTCGGAANSFINGGNSFGANATLGTNDNFTLSFRTNNTNQLTLDTSGTINLLNGGLKIGGTSVLTSGRVLQNVTADTSILTSGTLGANRGGTGINSYTVGDLLYASGTTALSSLADTATGNVLLSGGVGAAPSWGKVVLGTHTSGNYVDSLGTLTGLSVTGNSGASSTPALSVIYGSGVNTAAQGNTTLSFSGSGNLTGTVSGTAGGGFTANTLNVVANPSFSGLITGSSNTTGLALTGTPANSATSSLLQIGSAIASGNSALNGGTYLGLNAPNSGAGSAADFLNFQVSGSYKLKVDNTGLIDTKGGLAINGTTVLTSGAVLQNVTANTSILTTGILGVARGGTGAGTFTANGVLFGNGTGAFGVTAAGTTGQCLVATTGNIPTWGSCAGAGSGVSLQTAYDGGAAVLTADAKDIAFTLADTTTDSNFLVNIATGSTSKFAVQSNGTDVLRVTSAGVVVNTGGLTVNAGGAAITGNTSVASGTFTSSGGTISLNDASNFVTKINTGSSTGTITLGGGSSPLVIDSTNFDVSSAGALSGITTIATSGTINGQTIANAASFVTSVTAPTINGSTGLQYAGTDINTNTALSNVAYLNRSSQTFSGGLIVQGANALTLGQASTNTGALVFQGSGGTGTLTVKGPITPNAGNFTLTIPAITTNANICTDNSVCSGYAASTGGSGYIQNQAASPQSSNFFIQNAGAATANTTVIRQSASQTGDLLQLQSSGGNYMAAFQSDGLLNLGVVNGTGVGNALANTVGDKILLWANGGTTRFGFGIQPSALVAHIGGVASVFAVRVDPGSGQASSGSNVFSVSGGGNVVATGTYNTNTFTSTALTFGGAGAATIQAANNQNLTVQTQGTGALTLNTGSTGLLTTNASTIRRTAAGTTTFDLVDSSNTTFAFTNSGAGNLNLTVDGNGTFGTGLSVSAGGATITGNSSITSGTFSSSGGLVSLNDTSNFGTNINTGSSSGTITLGGGSAPLVIDSTAFDVTVGGNISTPGTYNTNTFTSTALTFGGASGTISTTSNGNLTIGPNGSGVLALNTGSGGTLTTNASTIQRSGATGLTLDLANASTTTLTVTNSDASNVANLSVEGGITAGTNSAFSVNTDGDVTGVARQLDGSSTANGGSGLGSSTSLTLVSAANFDVGNYVRVTASNCGGTGINPCYAKITAKATNTLTIAPALTWTNGSAVVEFHFPEIGGVDTAQTLANRYGRGYFISGVATGNGTTYYNEDSVTSSLANFDFLSAITGTLNIGVGANQITLGGSGTTTTFAGNVSFTGTVSGIGPSTGTSGYLQRNGTTISPATAGDNFTTSGNISTSGSGTITAAAGLTVQGGGASITGNSSVTGTLGVSNTLTISGGGASITGGLTLATGALNLTSGGITNTGSLAGVTTISASGAITAATSSNTINGLIISSGALTGVTGITFTSGALNLNTGGITNAGSIAGATTLGLSGAITGATSINTINGLIINSGALSGITGLTFTSGSLNLNNGGLTNGGAFSGLTTLGLSGAITGATSSNTINGLVINSGTLSSITGITFTSGSLNLNNGGITNAGSITGVGTNITANAGLTIASTGSNALTLQGNSASLSVGGVSGNVGVGTASPQAVLHVSSSAATPLLRVTDATATAVDVFNIADEGAATFQNRTNSTAAFTVKNANGDNLIKVDTTANNTNNLITNPSIESAITSNWALKGSASVSQDSTDYYYGANSLKIITTTTGDGAKQNVTLANATTYTLTLYARSSAGNMATLEIGHSENGSTDTACLTNQSVYKSGWNRYSCTFTTGTVSGTQYIYIKQTDATARTAINIDSVILQTEANNTPAYRDGQIALQGNITTPLTIQNSSNSSSALQVLSSKGANILDIGTTDNNILAGNAGFEVNANGWTYSGTPGSVARDSTTAYTDTYSIKVTTTANANNGLKFTLASGNPAPPALSVSTTYTLSWYAKLDGTSAAFTDIMAAYARDGSTETNCTGITSQTVVSGGWTRYSCQVVTDSTTPAAGAYIVIKQTGATAHTFYVDSVQLEQGLVASAYGAGTISWNATITSPIVVRTPSDSTTTFQVQNAASTTNVFTVDTLNGRVGIGTAAPTQALDVVGNAQISGRLFVPGTSGTAAQGYFTGTATTQLGGFQSLDLGGNTYNFLATNKYYNGTTWVDNGQGRVGSSFQMQNDAFTFYSFDTCPAGVCGFTPRFTVASGGNVGIGLSGAPGALLSVGGTTGNFQVNTTGAFTATSGLVQATGTGAPLILNRTDGVIGSLKSGSAKVAFLFDNTGTFGIGTDTRANIAAGNTAGTDLLSIAANGNITVTAGLSGLTTLSLSGAITGATATNTINGLVINAGALSSITTLNSSGLATISGGATISGATINLNAGSNFAANINTGTSTGTVTIGGGSAPLVINSTAFDVSSAGALSGITTIAASGNINTTAGVYQVNGVSGLTIAACTAGQYIGNGVATAGGIITAGTCRNDATGISDVRVKKDITSVGSVLDKLEGVRVVTFNFKVDELPELNLDHGLQYGVIAQELEQIFPELVSTRDDGYKEVNFKGLSFYTLKAITELSAKVSAIGGGAGSNEIATDGVLRLSHDGVLQNITGFNIISGGATIAGGINNNGGGITNIGAVLGATTINGQGLSLAASGNDNLLTLTKDNKGVFTVFNNGALGLQLDATDAFSVKDASGIGIFSIDTQNGKVIIGSGNNTKTALFVLDSRSTIDDPAGTNGASYYNAAANRFRCYQDGKWQDCLPAGDLTTTISATKVTWHQPADDTEFPDTPRSTISLNRAHEFRLNIRVIEAGAINASCRLQYATSDNGPWNDLMAGGAHDLVIDHVGTLKTDWVKIADGARIGSDTIVRVMCKGGDSGASPVIYGVSLQIR